MMIRRIRPTRVLGENGQRERSQSGGGTSDLGRELREEIRRAVSEQLRAALEEGMRDFRGGGGRGEERSEENRGSDGQLPVIQVVLPPGGPAGLDGASQGGQNRSGGMLGQGLAGSQGGAGGQGGVGAQLGGVESALAGLAGGAQSLLAAREQVIRELEAHLPRLRQVIAETQKIAEKIELMLGQGGAGQGGQGGQRGNGGQGGQGGGGRQGQGRG